MGIFLNPVTQVKEMFLKKINNFFVVCCYTFILFAFNNVNAEALPKEFKTNILNYINSIEEFSSSFLQSNGKTIEEGNLYIKNKRIIIQYNTPSKIKIIIAHNKAMYFNEDLQEVEYFNPKNSVAELFYKIFYDLSFFDSGILRNNENILILEKNISFEDEKIKL